MHELRRTRVPIKLVRSREDTGFPRNETVRSVSFERFDQKVSRKTGRLFVSQLIFPSNGMCVAYGPPELSQRGMMTQQQLRTSPVVNQMIIVTILFLESHTWAIRFPIPARSVGFGVGELFILLFHPYRESR